MSSDICIFKRIEKKYMLTADRHKALLTRIQDRLIPDAHGRSTVCSLYLDTPDFLLIRNSIDAKVYKEKLRLRCYGIPRPEDPVFLELKKKYKGMVYKRRVGLCLMDADDYIRAHIMPPDSQIMREIDYAMNFYGRPKPIIMVSYERDAFFGREDHGLRITFDTAVRYRTDRLSPVLGNDGKTIISDDTVLMEIKTEGAMPLWLSRTLSEMGIFPSSFSKYGTAYRDLCQNQNPQISFKGDICHV